jgi:predicted Zn-dependent protease
MEIGMKLKMFFLVFFLTALSLQSEENVLLSSSKKELFRAFNELKTQSLPPYFIAYGITDTRELRLTSSFGKIERCDSNRRRVLDVDLRVGSPELDNTHIIRGQRFSFSGARTSFDLPIENNTNSISQAIWFATDRVYKSSVETFDKVKTNKAVKVAEEDSSADFTIETAQKYNEPVKNFNIDIKKWEAILNKVSSYFTTEDWIYFGKVILMYEQNDKYMINSEGVEIVQSEPYLRVYISASTKADDGMSLPLYQSYFAFTPENLPDEATLISAAKEMISTLKTMRVAPLMSTYSGPAILAGEASGVFFHEIFGHRVEGFRLKDPDDAQTFKNSINQKVISDVISVEFDPTIKEMRGKPLSGYYKYDDEGVKAQKVDVVESGVFKNFLMSRSPIQGFSNSNGHGRREPGNKAVTRQSNLIVKSNNEMSMEKLREELIKEAKAQGKEFGLYFVKVQGGFTFTGRAIPNSFNVNPLLVYKIYVDGRPDEMVRGVDLIGTPLTTFSHISATANDFEVFNGICGAESGGVPVSACSPTILVTKIEVQKKKKSQAKLPILTSPLTDKNP